MDADDMGNPVAVPARVGRIVSLVPSLTETVASVAPERLVGVTDWCTHPGDLDVARIGGTKNPAVARIVSLAPDVVLANEEENRETDLQALRSAGVAVWVTRVRGLAEAFTSLDRMLRVACRLARPRWLDDAESAWAARPAVAAERVAVVPIWRRPWMVLGSDTFAGDVLTRLGVRNAFAHHAERYPRVALAQLQSAELVILPDEPYPFSRTDGPECFAGQAVALVSGRHLTWYGPSLVEAPDVLAGQLARRAARRGEPG